MNKYFRFLFCVALGLLSALLLASCSSALAYDALLPTQMPTVTPSLTLSPAPSLVPTATPETCKVSTGAPAGYLNLRAGTGMSYAVVRVLNEGETLTVMNTGDWLEVKDAQGNHGYINSKYCKEV